MLDRTPEDIICEEKETEIMHEETDREWFPEEDNKKEKEKEA